MSWKRNLKRIGLGGTALLLVLAGQILHGTAWSDDGRTGKDFSELLYDARGFFSDFDFSRVMGCGTKAAVNLVNTLFKTRAEFYLGDTTDPDKPRQWRSVSGPLTTIDLKWARVSDKGSAGAIFVQAFVSDDCQGKRPGDLKKAYVRYFLPVNGSSGHFSVAPPQDVKVETVCCGSFKRHNYVYNIKGVPLRMAGTDFLPLPPAPPKPRPSAGTRASSSGGSAASTTASHTMSAPEAPAPQPPPAPKPERFTMEKVCELCESQKAIVDHLKQRLKKLEGERDQVNQDMRDNRNRQAKLDKDLERLENELKAQKDVGAESTDPATGITTKSYDNGSGTVVVTRHYPDGRVEEIDRYPRRSTQDAQRDISSKEAEKSRLEQEAERSEKRLQQLDQAIQETNSRLQTELAALGSCIDLCNSRIGYETHLGAQVKLAATAPAEAAPAPAETAAAAAETASGGETGTATIGAAAEKAVETAGAMTGSAAAIAGTGSAESSASTTGREERAEAVQSQASATTASRAGLPAKQNGAPNAATTGKQGKPGKAVAPPEAPRQAGAKRSKPIRPFKLDPSWQLGAGINFSAGWKDKLKKNPTLQIGDAFKGTQLTLAQTIKSQPSRQLVTKAQWNKFALISSGRALFTLLGAKLHIQKHAALIKKYAPLMKAGEVIEEWDYWNDPIFHGAFALLDDYESTLEVGAFIGSSIDSAAAVHHIDVSKRPGFFDMIAHYTYYVLDEYEYDEYEYGDGGPLFSPLDVGNAVYGAVRTAGGSHEEAARLAEKYAKKWGTIDVGRPLNYRVQFHVPLFQDRELKYFSPSIAGFVDDPDSYTGPRGEDPDSYAGPWFNEPWSLNAFYAELDRVLRSYDQVVPDDPLYKKSGGLAKVGGAILKGLGSLFGGGSVGVGAADEDEADDQWGLRAVGFTPEGTGKSAWDIYDGRQKNIVVAVIDSGLDLKHPDRPKYIWKNAGEIPGNGLDDDGNGYVDDINGWNFVSENNNVDDDYGHGTFVTGIIAANTNNGEGIAGINPGARIMVLKASDGEGAARDLAVYRALRYAVDNGAWVINICLGNSGKSRLVQIGLNYAHAMGRIVVVAAGNEDEDIAEFTPQGSRRVISVGSMNIDGTRRINSNKGLGLDLMAPGQSIYSLTAAHAKRDGRIAPILAGKYHRLNGTSFAAPFVTGVASLIWARNPKLTNTQVEDMLLASAAPIGKPGWHAETGMGHLSAYDAMVQSPKTAFAPRITEVYLNMNRHRVESVDVYGIVRGPVQSYSLDVGQGKEPDKDEWQRVFGPSQQTVDLGLIVRIPGTFFSKGSLWTIRLTAMGLDGKTRVQQFLVKKKKDSEDF